MYQTAYATFDASINRRAWTIWRRRLEQVRQVKDNHEHALLHWMSVTQQKVRFDNKIQVLKTELLPVRFSVESEVVHSLLFLSPDSPTSTD